MRIFCNVALTGPAAGAWSQLPLLLRGLLCQLVAGLLAKTSSSRACRTWSSSMAESARRLAATAAALIRGLPFQLVSTSRFRHQMLQAAVAAFVFGDRARRLVAACSAGVERALGGTISGKTDEPAAVLDRDRAKAVAQSLPKAAGASGQASGPGRARRTRGLDNAVLGRAAERRHRSCGRQWLASGTPAGRPATLRPSGGGPRAIWPAACGRCGRTWLQELAEPHRGQLGCSYTC